MSIRMSRQRARPQQTEPTTRLSRLIRRTICRWVEKDSHPKIAVPQYRAHRCGPVNFWSMRFEVCMRLQLPWCEMHCGIPSSPKSHHALLLKNWWSKSAPGTLAYRCCSTFLCHVLKSPLSLIFGTLLPEQLFSHSTLHEHLVGLSGGLNPTSPGANLQTDPIWDHDRNSAKAYTPRENLKYNLIIVVTNLLSQATVFIEGSSGMMMFSSGL